MQNIEETCKRFNYHKVSLAAFQNLLDKGKVGKKVAILIEIPTLEKKHKKYSKNIYNLEVFDFTTEQKISYDQLIKDILALQEEPKSQQNAQEKKTNQLNCPKTYLLGEIINCLLNYGQDQYSQSLILQQKQKLKKRIENRIKLIKNVNQNQLKRLKKVTQQYQEINGDKLQLRCILKNKKINQDEVLFCRSDKLLHRQCIFIEKLKGILRREILIRKENIIILQIVVLFFPGNYQKQNLIPDHEIEQQRRLEWRVMDSFYGEKSAA